ncbi:MAG: RNA-binding protein [Thermoprotei archaeon]|nr:MAG: RNA-binding protein [Thermoprotei archaeon]
MCESKAVLLKNGEEETIMDDVVLLETKDHKYVLYRIDGNKIELSKEYKLLRIDFLKHKIYFKTE